MDISIEKMLAIMRVMRVILYTGRFSVGGGGGMSPDCFFYTSPICLVIQANCRKGGGGL